MIRRAGSYGRSYAVPGADIEAGAGSSPTIRTRVTPTRKREVDQLRAQLGMKSDSDVVRAALDEYVQRHLQASA